MFIALDEDKKLISIDDASKDKHYFCPTCGANLIVKAGASVAVRKHFAHSKCSDCDSFERDMSEWHYNWQLKFPIENREVTVIKDGIKHRADILINNTVIEFQHSPITKEEIEKRNSFYLSCGYKVLWVFDADGQIKNEIENTIDPMESGTYALCWKRKKSQFFEWKHEEVKVFIEYKTKVSNSKFTNQLFTIMLKLNRVDPKYISFKDTFPIYIQPTNFLKEFGIGDETTLSISEIESQSKKHKYGRY